MVVEWDEENQVFTGRLTTLGAWSEWVGFSLGELVWTAAPGNMPNTWIQNQKRRSGDNGQSSASFWRQAAFTLDGTQSLLHFPMQAPSFVFSRPGAAVPPEAACIPGEWESQEPVNRWRMRVEWNPNNQALEGRLTEHGAVSASVGFALGELVWTATSNAEIWTEGQEWRTGANGVSVGLFWQTRNITIDCTTSPPALDGTSTPFVKVGE
jgi:hypothetical protein